MDGIAQPSEADVSFDCVCCDFLSFAKHENERLGNRMRVLLEAYGIREGMRNV